MIEIMLNPSKDIYVENCEGMQKVGTMEPGYSETLIKVIASLINEEVGALSGKLGNIKNVKAKVSYMI